RAAVTPASAAPKHSRLLARMLPVSNVQLPCSECAISINSGSRFQKKGKLLVEKLESCMLCQSGRIESGDVDLHFCRCSACGYIFDSPRPTYDELVTFYSQPGKYDHWLRRERARAALWRSRLKKFLPHCVQGNLLDVGTGTGQFLHHAKRFFSRVHG